MPQPHTVTLYFHSILYKTILMALLIYGATGYTGRLATAHANELGLNIILGGRSPSTKTLATSLNLPFRIFTLDNPDAIDAAISDITVVLNTAGPFHRTAEPLIEAAIRNKTHYLDVAAELDSYKLAEKNDARAKEAGVMLLPGCGGSVAQLGCLAGHAVDRVAKKKKKKPASIDISLYVAGSMSRGSAISASENMTARCVQILDGELVPRDDTTTLRLDFDTGAGELINYPVTLPDLITLRKSTKVRNIRTWVHPAGDAFPTGDLASLPDGPTAEERAASPYHAVALVTAEDGSVTRSVLHTVNGYTFTGVASAEGARRVLGGEVKAGFQTPVEVFGSRFVEVVEGTRIVDF
ncbi:Saccharopine dehydrogenase-domain-containing protein [Aspergillus californicus]